jgi:hypothetical protein
LYPVCMVRLVVCLVMLLGLGGCLFMVDDSGTGYLRAKTEAELRSWVLYDSRTSEKLAEGIHVLGLWVRGTDETAAVAHARVLVEVFEKLERGGYWRVGRTESRDLQAFVIKNLYGPTVGSRAVLDELRERVSDRELSEEFSDSDEREWTRARAQARSKFGEPAVIEQQAGDESRFFRAGTSVDPPWRVRRETWYYTARGKQVVMERGSYQEEPIPKERMDTLRSVTEWHQP